MLGGSVLFGLTALAYALTAGAVLVPRLPGRSNVALAVACAISAAWATAWAIEPVPQLVGSAAALDFLRAGGWFGYLLALTHQMTGQPRRWRSGWLLAVLYGTAALAFALLAWRVPAEGGTPSLISLSIDARLALAIGILLLIENLYRNTAEDARWHINLACIAVAGMFLYEILFYADTVLYRRISPWLFLGQAPANFVLVPLLLLTARRQRQLKEEITVSRGLVFHTATLLLSGIFLVSLAAAGAVFRRYGSGWGTLVEASLIFGGCIAIAVLASSASARSRLRALVVDHFFARRYDYQREWIRCISTLSAAGPYLALHRRVIRAVADIVDSPAGVLFLRETQAGSDPATFRAAGSWNAPRLEAVVVGPDHPLPALFQSENGVARAEAGRPCWFSAFPEAWLAVALPDAAGPAGFIVLAKSRAPFQLDDEVFELLRIIGREVALFIAERRATEALVEARQFAEAGRHFAFIAHDIKNVAGQLSLLLGNAEQHLENPAFRADMLATLRSSVQRISGLLARLQGPATRSARPHLSPAQHLAAAVEAFHRLGGTPVLLEASAPTSDVAMEEAAFDAVIQHLIDNAIGASPTGTPVRLRLAQEAGHVVIEVTDCGSGMSEEFVREALFRPFTSTKSAGFGLGAFQARALVREAGGELTVISALGQGTTMRISLPAVACEGRPALALSASDAAPKEQGIERRGLVDCRG